MGFAATCGGHRPRSAAHPGPRTAACGRGCSSRTACSTLRRCPDTRLAGFLKVPEIKDGKRFYETRHLSRANPHSDPTTPLGVGAEGQGRAGGGGTYSLLSHQTPGRCGSLSQWGVSQTRPPRTPLAAHPTVSGRSQTHDSSHPSSRGPALLHRPSPRSHCYRDRHTPPPLPDRFSSHGPSPTPSSKTESGAPRAWPGPCTPPVRRCPFKP